MDRLLAPDDFLIVNRLKPITTVFPATTVAATTSMLTGLNPCETGMLGWDMWYPGLGRVITTFWDSDPQDKKRTPIPEAKAYREDHMVCPRITDEINDAGRYGAYFVSPFGDTPYRTRDEMFDIVARLCRKRGKKYVYAYHSEPDHTLHEHGSNSEEARALIRNLSRRIELLSQEVSDAVIIVTADHGHHDMHGVYIDEYPDLRDCISGDLFLESRARGMFVKPGRQAEFEQLFDKYLGRDFMLVSAQDAIESKLFGDGTENGMFRDCLGDYIAIATGDKALLNPFNKVRKSHHAGYTDDEILVPLSVCQVGHRPKPLLWIASIRRRLWNLLQRLQSRMV